MPKVFISYSSTDREFVLKLAQDLQARDFEVWLDVSHITGREPFWREIQNGIESCDLFLFVISPDSIQEGSGARDELGHAKHHRKQLVALMVRSTDYNALPIEITPGRHQIHDFTRLDYDDGLRRVSRAMGGGEPKLKPPFKPESSQMQIKTAPLKPPPELQKASPRPPKAKQSSKAKRRFDPRLIWGAMGMGVLGFIWLALLMVLGAWQLGLFEDGEGNNGEILGEATSIIDTPTNMPPVTVIETSHPGLEAMTRNADWVPVIETVGGVEMALVPTGCFMMGSTDEQISYARTLGAGDWVENEQPVHEQCFYEPFWIGRYEVTNAEYARFVEAGGYDNADYWTEEGWTLRQSDEITKPSHPTDSNFNADQQPVVRVSWYEVYAYTQWLSETTGLEFRLPTEAEWEYAARGPDAWVYPWGDEFIGENLNFCDENCEYDRRDASVNDGYSYTAPIGTYPQGASWVGALDMAGNVFEWVLNRGLYYPYVADEGRDIASNGVGDILRGGSWETNANPSRAAARIDFLPFFGDTTIGFRLFAVYTTP